MPDRKIIIPADPEILAPFTPNKKEECGIFGIFGHEDCAKLAYFGLYALQHRGQESAGIAVGDGCQITSHKNMGLVHDIFSEETLKTLQGLPCHRACTLFHHRIVPSGKRAALRGFPREQPLCDRTQREPGKRNRTAPGTREAGSDFPFHHGYGNIHAPAGQKPGVRSGGSPGRSVIQGKGRLFAGHVHTRTR